MPNKLANFFKPTYRKILIIAMIVAFFSFLNAVRGPFLWDDESNLTLSDRHLYGKIFLSNLDKLFSSQQYQFDYVIIGGDNRPITSFISAIVNYTLGNHPSLWHLQNIILHLTIGLLIFLILKKINRWWFNQSISNITAAIGAIIFWLHPAQVESVSYISSFAGLWSGLFFLSSILGLLKFLDKKKIVWLITSAILFFLAVFAKENALIFVPILVLIFLFYKKRRALIAKTAPIYLAISGIHLYFTFFFLRPTTGGYSANLLALETKLSLMERLMNFPLIILGYLKILLLPIGLHMERHFWIGGLNITLIILIIIGFVALVVGLVYLAWRRAWLKFFLLWILLALGPFYQLIPLNATIAERWLYLPMLGFAGLVGILIYKIWEKTSPEQKPYFYQIVFLVLILMIVRIVIRNEQWANPLKLYQHDAKLSTNSFVVQNNVGVELFRAGRLAEAKPFFAKAIEIEPNYSVAHNNYAVILQNEGDFEKALKHYALAINLNRYYLSYVNTAKIYLKTGDFEQAGKIIKAGLEVYPTDSQLLNLQKFLEQNQ